MSRCSIVHFFVSDNTHSIYGGPAIAVHRCEAHGMELPSSFTEELCPIGKIEEATDKALSRIEEAMRRLHESK